jgi:hypothetical protein
LNRGLVVLVPVVHPDDAAQTIDDLVSRRDYRSRFALRVDDVERRDAVFFRRLVYQVCEIRLQAEPVYYPRCHYLPPKLRRLPPRLSRFLHQPEHLAFETAALVNWDFCLGGAGIPPAFVMHFAAMPAPQKHHPAISTTAYPEVWAFLVRLEAIARLE